jgi:hypothetical protein
MFKNKKIESGQQLGKLGTLKLKMFRSGQAFQASVVSSEGIVEDNTCEDSQRNIQAYLLEAECKKAGAIRAYQSNRQYC